MNIDIRCERCGKPHFVGDCKLDPNYEKYHFVLGKSRLTGLEISRIRSLAEKTKAANCTNGSLEGVLAQACLLLLNHLDQITAAEATK